MYYTQLLYPHSDWLFILHFGLCLQLKITMDAPIDETTKSAVQKLPLLTTRAGPRDGENWTKRLKEEYLALIQVRATERSLSLSAWLTNAPLPAVCENEQGG